jgi:hypothetical protein
MKYMSAMKLSKNILLLSAIVGYSLQVKAQNKTDTAAIETQEVLDSAEIHTLRDRYDIKEWE